MTQENRGFTLVEMSVVLVILALALAFSVPPFQKSLQRAKQDRVPAELASDLKLAISSAKATGRTVRFVFSTNGYQIRDAADSTLIRDRDFGGHVSLVTTGDPMVFPWGLVQPTEVELSGHDYNKTLRISPTGRVDSGVNP